MVRIIKPTTWRPFEQWSDPNESLTLAFDSDLTSLSPLTKKTATFTENYTEADFNQAIKQPSQWLAKLLTANNEQPRIILKGQPVLKDALLRGTPTITTSIKSSKDYGMLSAYLFDFGTAKRFNISPSLLQKKGLQLGHQWREDDLREFTLAEHETDYKMISFGHINLQNRHSAAQVDELAPNQLVEVTFELQPIFHHLLAGHQLGVMLFSTDFAMSQAYRDEITYELNLAKSSITIPSVNEYLTSASI